MKKATSLRPITFKKSYLPHAEGSCMVSMGHTKVLCVATVENQVPPHAEAKAMGWVHAEYCMLPRSGETRTSRQRAATSGRTQEISRLVGRALRAAVNLKALYPYTIVVDCDVIRADGGTRTASVNGGYVALAEAISGLKKKGLIQWPLEHEVGAVSLGVVNKKIILDMCYAEDKDAGTDLNIVMTSKGKLIEIQGTAEGAPFSVQELNKMIRIAQHGIQKITRLQKKAIASHSST